MNKKWMPITAGVMDIINGIGGIIVGTAFLTILRISALYSSSNAISGYLILLAGILSILGGIYSFKREKWILVFAGTLVSIGPSIPYMYLYWPEFQIESLFKLTTLLGLSGVPAILAIILIILSREQFK